VRYCVIDETTDRSTATDKKPLGDALSTNKREDQGLSPPWSHDFVSEELFGNSLAGLTVGARDAAPGAWGGQGTDSVVVYCPSTLAPAAVGHGGSGAQKARATLGRLAPLAVISPNPRDGTRTAVWPR